MVWEEAQFSEENLAKESQLTTDDLVLMIGEFAIKERQANRVIIYLKQQIGSLQQSIAGEQSKFTGEQSKQKTLQEQVTTLEADKESQQSRILQLEEQIHQVALERDEANAEIKKAVTKSH